MVLLIHGPNLEKKSGTNNNDADRTAYLRSPISVIVSSQLIQFDASINSAHACFCGGCAFVLLTELGNL